MNEQDTIVYYEQIRKIISKLDRRNFAKFIIKNIRETERISEIHQRRFYLWNLFFLLKMTAKFGSFFPYKKITLNQLLELHDLCIKLNDFLPKELGSENHISASKVLRIIFYQQVWLQNVLNYQDIGRIIKLIEFSEFDPVSSFDNGLNLSTRKFLKYTYILYIWAITFPQIECLNVEDILPLIEDKEAFELIINYLKRDISEVGLELDKNIPVKSERLEIFEQSALFRFPIWAIDGRHYLLSTKLLERSILHLLIEKLSAISSSQGNDNYLSVGFEKYVGMYLAESKEKFLNEGEIRKRFNLGSGDKVTDFLISNLLGNVCIECKAILAQSLTKVLPKKDVLINSYKDNIVKAIVQGIDTHSYMKYQFWKRKYLLIVTLEDLYLGCFKDLLEEFIEDALRKHYPGYESRVSEFGTDNIFIISISNYELLISYSKQEKISLERLLRMLTAYLKKNKIYSNFIGFFQDFLKERNGIDCKVSITTIQDVTKSLFREIEVEAKRALSNRT